MNQLFVVGEEAILQSTDAPQHMWNAHVVITKVKWADNPIDIFGMPLMSTFIYEIDWCGKMFIQQALRKITYKELEIKEQSSIEIDEPCKI